MGMNMNTMRFIEADYGELHIRQAMECDIPCIECMYLERVIFNDEHQIHQWNLDEVTWSAFSTLYQIQDYYVGEYRGNIVCGLFIVDVDALYWRDKPKGDALYLHKICVDPMYGGRGYADNMITFFKEKGKREGYDQVRLDVREHKTKLRTMYERNGFQLCQIKTCNPEFSTALYEYKF